MKRPLFWIGAWLGVIAILVGFTAREKIKPTALESLWPVPRMDFVGVTSQGATPMNTQNLQGQPWVANFIFTSCGGPCPVMSGKMAALQRVLPSDVKLVSFTVDPVTDTPAVLQAYAQRFHAEPQRWIFARLPKEALYKMVYEGFRLSIAERRKDPAETRVLHSTQFVLVDRQGTVRAYYDSNGDSLFEHLSQDVKRLKEEKS